MCQLYETAVKELGLEFFEGVVKDIAPVCVTSLRMLIKKLCLLMSFL